MSNQIKVIQKATTISARVEINYNYGSSSVLFEGEAARDHTSEREVAFLITSSIRARSERLLSDSKTDISGVYQTITIHEGYGFKVVASNQEGSVEFSVEGVPHHEWEAHKARTKEDKNPFGYKGYYGDTRFNSCVA